MTTEHPNPHPDGGFVPRLGADPSQARYELITTEQAIERVAAVGFDRADAQQMVTQYIEAWGPGPGDGWRVDPYDLAEIAAAYDWVDHYRGETIADARARAAGYAADLQGKAAAVDRERDPGYAARLDRDAAEWSDRARDGHTPWPVVDLAEEDEPWTAEQVARSELLVSASWALANRDAAIEQDDTEHATQFAQQAREAVAAAEAAGITREQLAAELDYPGGAPELDGAHIEYGIQNGRPYTAAQLAILDAAALEAMDLAPTASADHQSSASTGAAGAVGAELVMPAWMAEQARATEAAIAAGTHPPVAVDDPAEIAARVAALRAHTDHDDHSDDRGDDNGDGDEDGSGAPGRDDGPRPAPLGGPDAALPDATAQDDAPREEVDADGDLGAMTTHTGDQPGELRDEAGVERDDPEVVAWWAPAGVDAVALSHRDVEQELTARGFTPDQARTAIGDYLDETSERVGVSVHRWGLDSHDVEAITHTHRPPPAAEAPEQPGPAARGEWGQVRGDDPRSYGQMMGDAAAALAGRPVVSAEVEDQRREQLIRWHTDDHTSTHADGHADGRGDEGPVRGRDDYAPAAAAGQEW